MKNAGNNQNSDNQLHPSSTSITLQDFRSLLEQQLAPIHEHIASFDGRLNQLRVDMQQDMWESHCKLMDDMEQMNQDHQDNNQKLIYRIQNME